MSSDCSKQKNGHLNHKYDQLDKNEAYLEKQVELNELAEKIRKKLVDSSELEELLELTIELQEICLRI